MVMETISWMETITLPYSATINDICGYEHTLAQSVGIVGHEYLRLSIDSGSMLSYTPGGKATYRLTKVKLWAVSPFNYHKKTRSIKAPKDKDFVVSIATLKKKLAELEDWYQAELELKAQKDRKAQEQKTFVGQCRADGLPMYADDSPHWFQVAANGGEDLSITIAARFTKAQAIALHKFLQELYKGETNGQ